MISIRKVDKLFENGTAVTLQNNSPRLRDILASQARGVLISHHSLHFFRRFFTLAIAAMAVSASSVSAESVTVNCRQGSLHGFLVLKSRDGRVIAIGEQTNVIHGDEVHAELVFHFRDGSIDDEVTDYKQGEVFQLLRDHHVQKGPSFPQPLDMTIDMANQTVAWQETKDGKNEAQTKHMDLPADLMNGMLQLVVENFPTKTGELKVSYLVIDHGPRVVSFTFTLDGEDRFRVVGGAHRANRYNVHIEIGGLAGVIAPVIGKKPADMKIWAIGGDAPLLVRMRGALYPQGPIWDMSLVSPTWSSAASAK
jgi:hypothetical protein